MARNNALAPPPPLPELFWVQPVFSPLVLIQAGSGGVPFFCVHGAGGNVINFRDIALRLGKDQAVYALQARGVDGERPLETIEEMAEAYLGEVRSVQPRGPYLLGGYSGGGVVAFEMAQRLGRSGDGAALVVFIDSFAPWVRPENTPLKDHVAKLFEEGPRYVKRRFEHKVQERLDALTNHLKLRFYAKLGKPLPIELRERELTAKFLAASLRYVAKPYTGAVVLYRAAHVAREFRHAGPKQGWDALAPHLEVVDVPGDHDSLVREPNAGVIASHLSAALRRAV